MRQSFVASTRRMRAAPDVLTLLKVIAGTMAFIAVAAALVAAWLWPRYPYLPATETPPKAERLLNEPLIHADPGNAAQAHFAEHGYVSITHPTLIRVPDWVEDPLGRYYLYFAHHKGGYIRLAYADDILGPWRTYGGGALALADSGFPADVDTADDPARALATCAGLSRSTSCATTSCSHARPWRTGRCGSLAESRRRRTGCPMSPAPSCSSMTNVSAC